MPIGSADGDMSPGQRRDERIPGDSDHYSLIHAALRDAVCADVDPRLWHEAAGQALGQRRNRTTADLAVYPAAHDRPLGGRTHQVCAPLLAAEQLQREGVQRLPGLYQSVSSRLGSTMTRRRPESGPVRRLRPLHAYTLIRGRGLSRRRSAVARQRSFS